MTRINFRVTNAVLISIFGDIMAQPVSSGPRPEFIQQPLPRPEFIRQQPPPASPPKASGSSWVPDWAKNTWRWTTSTAMAPVGWAGSAATEAALASSKDAFLNSKEEIVSNIVEMAHQTMYRQAPAAFEGVQSAVQRFLNTPDRERLAALQELLAQASVDQNPSVYQAITEAGKERVKALGPVLQGLAVEREGPPAPLAIDAATREHIQEVSRILSFAASQYTGVILTITRTADHLLNRVDQLLERAEHAPQKAISNVISPPRQGGAAPIAPPAGAENAPPPAPPSGQAEEGFISFNTILNQTGPLLSQIMGTAGQAVSQQAAGSLATMLVFVFDKIKTHLGQNQERQHIIETIDPLIEQLNTARKNNSWSELIEALQACNRIMRQQQVYFQNLRVPLGSVRASSSALPALLDNIRDLEATLHGSEAPSTAITAAMIEHEALKLQTRGASYGPIKFICEWILKLEPNDITYASLISIPENTAPSEWKKLFQTRVYALIDQSDSLLLTKWVAKAAYTSLLFISSFFAEALIFNGVAAFQKWQNAPEDRLNPREIQIIRQVKNWLAVLSASYNEAAATPLGQVRDFQQMLEKAIQAPERNGGLNSSELYRATSSTVIDTFGPRFQWRKSITQYYSIQIPSTAPLHFLNPLLTGLNLFCTWTVNAFLFIPEQVANTLMSWGTKFFLRSNPFLENSLNRTVDSLRSNTPTAYALNMVTYRQLQRVLVSARKKPECRYSPRGAAEPLFDE